MAYSSPWAGFNQVWSMSCPFVGASLVGARWGAGDRAMPFPPNRRQFPLSYPDADRSSQVRHPIPAHVNDPRIVLHSVSNPFQPGSAADCRTHSAI